MENATPLYVTPERLLGVLATLLVVCIVVGIIHLFTRED